MMPTPLRNVNATRVSKTDPWDYAAELDEFRLRPPNRVDMFGAMAVLARRLQGKPRKAIAVFARMQALARIVGEGAPGWTLPPDEDGCVPTQDVMFEAAATHPLVVRNNEDVFDRESFLARVLELSVPETTA